jgi:LacI family transcriptional regulator
LRHKTPQLAGQQGSVDRKFFLFSYSWQQLFDRVHWLANQCWQDEYRNIFKNCNRLQFFFKFFVPSFVNMATDQEITIYDIARHLNISATTVSRGLKNNPAINKNTRKKIAEAARLLGYRSNLFASSLRSKKTNTIGVIIPRINSYFMASVLAGMEDAASLKGYTLIINHSGERMEKEIINSQTLFTKRVDGLLISPAYDTDNIAHLEPFFRKKIPVIFFDRSWPHKESMSVEIDNVQAAYDITRHLLGQGFRRILFVCGNLRRNVYSDRLSGYKNALREAGVPYDEKRVIITTLTEKAGTEVAASILKMKEKERPDAVFAANDTTAVFCLLALKEAGLRIPQDIGIAGFNNDPISQVVSPKLTTIHYPGYLIGETAVTNLIHHLEGITDMRTTPKIILRSELIIRGSSIKKKSL